MFDYTIFTDGSTYWKNGLGGLGCYMKYGDNIHEISEGYRNTKINRMETMAVIRSLEYVESNSSIILYTDSEYVEKAFNEGRLKKMIRNGFRTGANTELWSYIVWLINSKHIRLTVYHINGHQKVTDELTYGNNRADELADYKQFDERITDISDEEWELVKSNKK